MTEMLLLTIVNLVFKMHRNGMLSAEVEVRNGIVAAMHASRCNVTVRPVCRRCLFSTRSRERQTKFSGAGAKIIFGSASENGKKYL